MLIILYDQHCFALFLNFPLHLPIDVISLINVLQIDTPIWWVGTVCSYALLPAIDQTQESGESQV